MVFSLRKQLNHVFKHSIKLRKQNKKYWVFCMKWGQNFSFLVQNWFEWVKTYITLIWRCLIIYLGKRRAARPGDKSGYEKTCNRFYLTYFSFLVLTKPCNWLISSDLSKPIHFNSSAWHLKLSKILPPYST